MTIRRGTLAAGLAVSVLVGGAACGGAGDAQSMQPSQKQVSQSSETGDQQRSVDVSVVRGASTYDYEPVPSLTELAEKKSAVAVGTVIGWTDGRSAVESDGSGHEYTSLFGVLEIDVVDSHRSPKGHSNDDRIYVEVPRGGETRIDGEAPEGTEPVLSTIKELNAAVPNGTRVIIAGEKAPTATQLENRNPNMTVENATAGHPEGTVLLRPHVQGLLFEGEDGDFVSGLADDEEAWGWVPPARSTGDEFSYLVAQLDTLG